MNPVEKQIEKALTGCENIITILEWISELEELQKERNIQLKIGELEKGTKELRELYKQVIPVPPKVIT